jgi:hypothetical protein
MARLHRINGKSYNSMTRLGPRFHGWKAACRYRFFEPPCHLLFLFIIRQMDSCQQAHTKTYRQFSESALCRILRAAAALAADFMRVSFGQPLELIASVTHVFPGIRPFDELLFSHPSQYDRILY